MFRFVGFIVVTGFALYGMTRFIDEHVACEKGGASGAGGAGSSARP